MTKISQLTALGDGLAPTDQLFVRDVSDSVNPIKSATPADILRAKSQGTPTAINVSATITPAQIKTGIITSSTAATVTITLPTGSALDSSFTSPYTDLSLEWYVINTGGSNSVVLSVSGVAGHTTIGSVTVTANTSGHFITRRTGANTYVTYRVS